MSLKNGLAVWLLIVTLSCGLPDQAAAEPMNWPCPGRCFDAAWISNKGYAYFLKGDQFWRYDIAANRVDHGHMGDAALKLRDFVYPRPMRLWPGLPQSWSNGISAALNGGDGKVYWFKGREYVRFDIATTKVDAGPRPIASQWPGLPPAWSSGFDAAVNWGNGKLIFFKGREALSYDLATGKAGEPRPVGEILRGLPDAWSGVIDTAVNWGNGKAYIFKGNQYVRYDIAGDKVDGALRPVARDWPGLMHLIDWSYGPLEKVPERLKVPERVISVGQDATGRPLTLCSAMVGDAIYPGKISGNGRVCIYAEGQRELGADVFAVAATHLPIEWTGKTAAPPDRLVPVGNSPNRRPYYLCRGRFANGVHPGRIEDLSGACTITHDGRSHVLKDNFEVASAPTPVNFPYMPHLVRLLSPMPGSERFKDVCFAEINPTFRGRALQGQYPRDLPDLKTVFQTVARNVCLFLYKNPSEVPRYTRKLELIVMDPPPGKSGLGDAGVNGHCTMRFDPRWMFPAESVPLPDLVMVFYHETAHCAQYNKGTGPLNSAFLEGHADYVRWVKVWGGRVTTSEGALKDGYESVAYFMEWLEQRRPEFVYRFNMSLARSTPVADAVRQLTGRPLDVLWREYQDSLPARLAQPESLLRWSPATTPSPNGIRVISGTYGGNCRGRLTGGAGGTPDKTPHLKAECEGKEVCEYSVVWQKIGDPAAGCSKDYVAVWQCPAGGGGTARAEPEAGLGSKVVLSCNR
jgi:hypothetical protein